MALTKADIIEAVQTEVGFTRHKSTVLVEDLIKRIKSKLEYGEDVLVSGFGKFCVNEKFLANWHEECVWRFPGNLSISGEFRGKKAVAEWFRRLVNQFPRFVLTSKNVCVKTPFDFVGTNVVTVNFTEEITDNDGNEYKFDGVTVVTLKLGKATHAEDYFFNTSDEIRKAWGE